MEKRSLKELMCMRDALNDLLFESHWLGSKDVLEVMHSKVMYEIRTYKGLDTDKA